MLTDPLSPAPTKRPPQRDPAQNHGRYGAADYTGCAIERLACGEGLQAGAPCPDCAAGGLKGRLYAVEAGVLIRLEGQPLVSGTCYEIEKLRCALCGQQYSAEVPPAIAQQPKYSASGKTQLALARYYFGLPFKRVETWQRLQGIPVPDATQFDQMRTLVPVVQPIYQCLQALAPEGQTQFYDDTPNRILRIAHADKGGSGRRGVYTTALVSQLGPYAIYLFSTSMRMARENVVPLLRTRQNPEAFVTMSDASPVNVPRREDADEHLLARWILSFCLVHGRRKFWEISGLHTPEADFVLDQISAVYRHDRYCRTQGLTDRERLAYHQAHSAPLLQALHLWLTAKLQFYEVEPNSALGQAMAYLLRHWTPLTRFLQVPGAPLDNSLCERAIKVIIRHRRNSQGFRTVFGAQVGDYLMSVIHTAVMNRVNVVDYLNALQYHAIAVIQAPEAWLPWHYQTVGLYAAAA